MAKKISKNVYQQVLSTMIVFLGSVSYVSAAFMNITIDSPLKANNITTVEGVILAVLNALIVIVTPLVVLAIIYAGFLYVTARGNAEQVKKATTALTYAVIGGLLAIGAVALSGIIEVAVDEFRV